MACQKAQLEVPLAVVERYVSGVARGVANGWAKIFGSK